MLGFGRVTHAFGAILSLSKNVQEFFNSSNRQNEMEECNAEIPGNGMKRDYFVP